MGVSLRPECFYIASKSISDKGKELGCWKQQNVPLTQGSHSYDWVPAIELELRVSSMTVRFSNQQGAQGVRQHLYKNEYDHQTRIKRTGTKCIFKVFKITWIDFSHFYFIGVFFGGGDEAAKWKLQELTTNMMWLQWPTPTQATAHSAPELQLLHFRANSGSSQRKLFKMQVRSCHTVWKHWLASRPLRMKS